MGLTGTGRANLRLIRDAHVDAKLEALLDLCARLWQEDAKRKIVIRCEYAATLDLVADRLRELLLTGALRQSSENERAAWADADDDSVGPVARLDGGEDSMIEALVDADRAGGSMLAHVAAFENFSVGGAIVLVALDVASVGLNLQFAHDLILYDLPWRLGLTEQWIGRLDRLGQRDRMVSVYVLTHPESPTRQLVDLYSSLGLFDAAAQGTMELDQKLTQLIHRADSDEISWREVMAAALKLLQEQDTDEAGGGSLDLKPFMNPIEIDAERDANECVLRAFAASGFALAEDDSLAEIRWPPTQQRDVVQLGEVRARLQGNERTYGRGNPEALAMQNQWNPVLRVDVSRISSPRRSRGSTADFLTPRHPLIAEARDELVADPTLAIGCFRVSWPSAEWPTGWFMAVLTRTFPATGGAALAWRTGALAALGLGDPDADEDLPRVFAVIEAGLQRACTSAFPPRVGLQGWQLASDASQADRPLSVAEVNAIRGVLSRGVRCTPNTLHAARFLHHLKGIEAAPAHCVEASSKMTRLAERAARYIHVVAAGTLRERERRVTTVGSDNMLDGIREHHQKRFEVAASFFERLSSLPAHAGAALTEALTVRAVAAALVEVSL
ncbi:helicase-related protein [Haliangium sp. UPWRP_2]|uniref:C-terminal helicase domain-containing protein n=1 Tax=Haliangium sp. UPWRP_2 TaxID=1931276 RepID=UPI001E2D4478|nr:helicase-related protein [Haliangium sp. UPWRP_2]